MKLAEILTGPETWGKGFRRKDGHYCLLGALSQLLHGTAYGAIAADHPEYLRLNRVIGAEAMPWNDDPARTWEEIQTVRDEYDRDRMLNP